MLFGRFVPIWVMLKVGGHLRERVREAPERRHAANGQHDLHDLPHPVPVIISALLFLPVLALGPLAQIVREGAMPEMDAAAPGEQVSVRRVPHTSWRRVLVDSIRKFDPRARSTTR